MIKKVYAFIIVLVLVVSMSACQGVKTTESTEVKTTESTQAKVETKTATDEKKEVELDRHGIAIGPVNGNTDDDYIFAGVFGGMNPYSDPYPGASKLASEEIGIAAPDFKSPQNWEQNEQNEILDGLIAKGVTGIYMMPSNAVAGNEQITKMVDAGIPVVCVGGPPELPTAATLTLATDVYNSAYQGTILMIEAMGGKGKVVGLSGAVSDPNTIKRFQAIEDACNEYPDVELFQTIGDIDSSEASITAVENLLSASGQEIGGIISTAYYPSVALATLLEDDSYSHIKAVGIDTDEKVMDAIREGHMLGTMSQNPWGQAYIATKTLKMLKDGWTYKEGQEQLVDSGSFFVNADNIDTIDDVISEVTDEILFTWLDRFNSPKK